MSRHGAAERHRLAQAPGGGHELALGVAFGCGSQLGKEPPAPGCLDHRAEVAGMSGGEILAVAGDEILRAGSRPSIQAANPTDVQIDFRCRGGTVMRRRRMRPSATCWRCQQMASTCPAGMKDCTGMQSLERLPHEGVEMLAQAAVEHRAQGLLVAHAEPPCSSGSSASTAREASYAPRYCSACSPRGWPGRPSSALRAPPLGSLGRRDRAVIGTGASELEQELDGPVVAAEPLVHEALGERVTGPDLA